MQAQAKPAKRERDEPAADDEPRVEFKLNGVAAACLQIDERSMWRNLEHVSRRRIGRMGYSYTVRLPVMDAERMLDDLISRGNQSGSEGWDQEAGAKYSCRKAAEVIAATLGKPKPHWWRG